MSSALLWPRLAHAHFGGPPPPPGKVQLIAIAPPLSAVITMRFGREVIVYGVAALMVLYGCLVVGPRGCEASLLLTTATTTMPPSPPTMSARKQKRSFADNLHSGIKWAGTMFGLDATTTEVADLVAKAFARPPAADQQRPPSTPDGRFGADGEPAADAADGQQFGGMAPPGLLSHMLRMFGMDGGKIGAMAVNGIIFIAQMIGKSLTDDTTPQPSDAPRAHNDNAAADEEDDITTGSPFDWILGSKSPLLKTALASVRDRHLTGRLIDGIGALEQTAGEADCIKLLLCKCSPFVWGMQRSIGERIDGDTADEPTTSDEDGANPRTAANRLDGFFRHLPAMREFRKNGDECERQHAACLAKSS